MLSFRISYALYFLLTLLLRRVFLYIHNKVNNNFNKSACTCVTSLAYAPLMTSFSDVGAPHLQVRLRLRDVTSLRTIDDVIDVLLTAPR